MATKLKPWIDACCSLEPGNRELLDDLYDNYKGWNAAHGGGAKALALEDFMQALRSHGVGCVGQSYLNNPLQSYRGPIRLIAGPTRKSDLAQSRDKSKAHG